jgi:hypothetical protein
MSECRWTGLVYGRSYQVDFNSIATPANFSPEDTQWALQYITATTRSADKLAGNPRWSLFKNENHCVIGVTCMVKDLIGDRYSNNNDDLTKDCQGRPLYIFVGYATELNKRKYLSSVPPYSGNNLELFEPLYQHVCEIWHIKEYEKFDELPLLTRDIELTYSDFQTNVNYDPLIAQQLNHSHKDKDRVFLWQDSEEYRKKLWSTAAKCRFPVSICLGFRNESDALSSPFLNGTASSVTRPQVISRTSKTIASKSERSLTELVKNKVQDDIQVTIHHVEKVMEVGQDLVQSITNNQDSPSPKYNLNNHLSLTRNAQEFGFKTKQKSKEDVNVDRSKNSSENWF